MTEQAIRLPKNVRLWKRKRAYVEFQDFGFEGWWQHNVFMPWREILGPFSKMARIAAFPFRKGGVFRLRISRQR